MIEYTNQMVAVIKAIAFIKKSKGLKPRSKLKPAEVERASAAYTEDNRPVTRGSWSNKGVRENWKPIQAAIRGTLKPDDHPVWMLIAKYNDDIGPAAEVYSSQLGILERTIKELSNELQKEKYKYQNLYTQCITNQYTDSHYRAKMDQIMADTVNVRKEKNSGNKLINTYSADNEVLRLENEKLRKFESLVGTVFNAKFNILVPDLTEIDLSLNNDDIIRFYTDSLSALRKKATRIIGKMKPNDVVIIFHSFNIGDDCKFIADVIPLRFEDNNLVIACCDTTQTGRTELYREVAKGLSPAKPRVVLVVGNGHLDNHSNSGGKVINLHRNAEAESRLKSIFAKRSIEYDPIREGFEHLLIKRV